MGHQADPRLRHQQEDHRGGCRHPLEAPPQQDCRVHHALDEEAAAQHRRGISIKLQEEERERRDNYVPDVSELEKDVIEVDAETKEMLKMMDFQSIPGLQMTTNTRPGFSNRN